MEQRISMVTLGVDDMGRARAFYERLGWRASSTSVEGQVTFFSAGGFVLGLYGRAALADDAKTGLGQAPGPVTLGYNVRERADVEVTLAEATAAGGRIVKPAEDVFWGGYAGYFADPDGHLWEVAWNPFWPIAADGRVQLPD